MSSASTCSLLRYSGRLGHTATTDRTTAESRVRISPLTAHSTNTSPGSPSGVGGVAVTSTGRPSRADNRSRNTA